jgi:hypothetical protein
MSIKRINQLPDGSGNLSNDDLFIFMDNPSASGVTKKISLSQLISALGGGGAISNIVEDTSPELGGSLDARNFSISGVSTLIGTSGNFISLQQNGTFVSLSGHTHTIVNVSGLQSALDGKQSSGNYAASSHTHTSSNITDFNSSVSGLLPSGLVRSNTSGIIGASGINNVVQINQADYNALVSKDPNTVYFVV